MVLADRVPARAMFRSGTWAWDRPYWMGVINVTPDSFSDGGELANASAVLRRAEALVAAGADMIDVGGESTNPRATAVSSAEELARVVPALRALCRWGEVPISIDTCKAAVAAAAIDEGAEVVNDISGGQFDPAMGPLMMRRQAIYIAGHVDAAATSLANLYQCEQCPPPHEVFARWSAQVAAWHGDRREAVWCDPGLGLGKGADASRHLALLAGMPSLVAPRATPLVIGASRKRFVRALLTDAAWVAAQGLDLTLAPTLAELDAATARVNVAAIAAGAHVIRVHNVAQSRQFHAQWRATAAADGISR